MGVSSGFPRVERGKCVSVLMCSPGCLVCHQKGGKCECLLERLIRSE